MVNVTCEPLPLCTRCLERPRSVNTRSGDYPDYCAECRRLARMPLCPGCGKRTKGKPLCRTCRKVPDAGYGSGQQTGAGRALPEPTDALPGSEEKIAVMAQRAAAGLAIFHPLDAQPETRPPLALNSSRTGTRSLEPEQVRYARALLSSGLKQAEVARRLQVPHSVIHYLQKGKYYRDVL